MPEVLHSPRRFSDFEVGDTVELCGFFHRSQELNGSIGRICGPFMPQCGRFPVQLFHPDLRIDIMVLVENMVCIGGGGSTCITEKRVSPKLPPDCGTCSAPKYIKTLRRKSKCNDIASCAVYRSALHKFSAIVSKFDDTCLGDKPTYHFAQSKDSKFTAHVRLFNFKAKGGTSTSKGFAGEYAAKAFLNGHFVNTPRTAKEVCSLDCEMVEVEGRYNALARVAVVGFDGTVLLDTYCQPHGKATSFRTSLSGVRSEDLVGAPDFRTVRSEVCKLISGKIVVGHGLDSDLAVLNCRHPQHLLRDSAKYPRLLRRCPSGVVCANSLQALASAELNCRIQDGEHCPIQDALAALLLYKKYKKGWDQWAENNFGPEEMLRMLAIFRATGRVY